MTNSYTTAEGRLRRQSEVYWLAMKRSWQLLCFAKDSAPGLTQDRRRSPVRQAPG